MLWEDPKPLKAYTHAHAEAVLGAKNISISEEAYERLVALKRPNESFMVVINRLTRKRSILELVGALTREEEEMRRSLEGLRETSADWIGSSYYGLFSKRL